MLLEPINKLWSQTVFLFLPIYTCLGFNYFPPEYWYLRCNSFKWRPRKRPRKRDGSVLQSLIITPVTRQCVPTIGIYIQTEHYDNACEWVELFARLIEKNAECFSWLSSRTTLFRSRSPVLSTLLHHKGGIMWVKPLKSEKKKLTPYRFGVYY